jgi:hypothetical protein
MVTETSRIYPSRILVIPDNTYTNLYGVFYDLNTGDMFDATTGAVSTTWANCAVVGAKHASNKAVWLLTTPPIGVDINVGLNLLQNASPADTDVPTKSGKYDPLRNTTYSDATPAGQGKTFTRK